MTIPMIQKLNNFFALSFQEKNKNFSFEFRFMIPGLPYKVRE